jgi:hypothetical protein
LIDFFVLELSLHSWDIPNLFMRSCFLFCILRNSTS